tara:strand:- start:27899 stop:28495 length:597 start_codon:yes stop_codon:yes gene_type:complete
MIDEKRYVLFDLETRNILGINRNQPDLSKTYFEIDYKDVEDFINNKKNPVHYYIDKDVKQSKYSIKLKKTDIAVKLIDDRLFKIPKLEAGDVIVENNIKEQKLTIKFDETFRAYLMKKYKITNDTKIENINIEGQEFLDFILCYDSDPHNLIEYARIPVLYLLTNKEAVVSYNTKHTDNCVYTKRIYDDYCYKELKDE